MSSATNNPSSSLSRRGFIASLSGAGFLLAARAGASPLIALVTDPGALDFEPDLFLSIAPDGLVTIVAHRSEMGTGIRTALPMVVADELGANWDRVKIVQAIGDRRYGSQNTDGSHSIRRFFDRMRVAGATARTMLERAAAQQWGVDPSECRGQAHEVLHEGSGKKLAYGDLVEAAAALGVPKPTELDFKPSAERTLIGTNVPLTDMDGLVSGQGTFGMDARLEDQLFAVIARSPVLGAPVKSFNPDEAMKVAGVVDVIELPGFEGAPLFQALGGVAVLAENTWAAIKGREALEIEWGESPHDDYDSSELEAALEASARESGKVWREAGDVEAAFADAKDDDVVEADYYVPLLAHAPMEPPCALADVRVDDNGAVTECEVWAPTQNPQAAQDSLAGTLGIPGEKAIVNVTLLGGGFGRKSKPDYIVEAALLSQMMGRPIHVTWTREDDIRHDYYHAVAGVHMSAACDENGMPKGWLQRSAFTTISSTFALGAREGGAGEMGMGFTDLPYAIDNLRVENGPGDAHVRIGWMRSVAHIYHAFGVCSFPDELAHRAGRDPLEYLMALLGEDRHLDMKGVQYGNGGESFEDYPIDIARLKHVTERAAKMAGWGRKMPKGRALGIACHRSFLSYCANVVEVEVSQDGTVKIPKVWAVIDAGLVVHPDRVKAQMEGAAVFGASLTLHGEISAKEGRIEQGNFDDYKIARSTEAPQEIEVEIVQNDAPPAGVGEVGVPPFAPAMCNAIHAATGKRIRRLPLAKHDLSWS